MGTGEGVEGAREGMGCKGSGEEVSMGPSGVPVPADPLLTATAHLPLHTQALLHELRTGERYSLGGGEAHRAKVARGPTTLQDLEQEANKEQGERGEGEVGSKGENGEGGGKGEAESGEQGGEGKGEGQGQGESGAGSSARGECGQTQGEAGEEQGGTQGRTGAQEQAGGEGASADGPGGGDCDAASVSGSGDDSKAGFSDGAGAAAEFIAAAAFAGPRAGYVFKKGPAGQGYYRDSAVSEGVLQYQREQQRPEGGDRGGSGCAAATTGAAGGPGTSAASQVRDARL